MGKYSLKDINPFDPKQEETLSSETIFDSKNWQFEK